MQGFGHCETQKGQPHHKNRDAEGNKLSPAAFSCLELRNQNPRKPSPTILSGFKQSDRHSSDASNVPLVPQFSIEHSRGRIKTVPKWETKIELKREM